MATTDVSVVIPAYRAARTIGRAIDSLFAQTVAPVEIIVVDDGSPDNIGVALASYGDRVSIFRKPNGGAASARNFGIEKTRGRFIAFLDADDHWEPQKLERQLATFERYPEIGLIAGNFYVQVPGEQRTAVQNGPAHLFDRPLNLSGVQIFDIATRVWTGTVIVRREALGHLRFVSGLEPAEDRDLWVRILSNCKAYLLREPLATAVLEPNSLSRSNVDFDCSNMLKVVQRHASLLGRRGLVYWEASTYRRWAAGHLTHGRPRAALKPAYERMRRQPLCPQGWWILIKSAWLSCLRKSNG